MGEISASRTRRSESFDAWSRVAGTLLFGSGIIFIIFNTIAESLYPNYSVRTNALSDLGAIGSPTSFLWDGQLFVTGVLSLVGMILLFYKSSALEISRRKLTGILYLLPSIGTIGVSLVQENTNLGIHTLFAFDNFLLGGMSAIYASRFIKRSPFRYFAVVLGLITLFSLTQLGNAQYLGFGGVERLVVYPEVLWGIGFGVYLLQ